MQVIATINFKGGVGKSPLAWLLAKRDKQGEPGCERMTSMRPTPLPNAESGSGHLRKASPAGSRILAALLLLACAMTPGVASAQCAVPEVVSPEVEVWSNKIIAALVGENACYADRSAFINSDCNIFAGRVLEQAYGVRDFVLAQPRNGLRYEVSNEIAVLLWTTLSGKWEVLGAMTDQVALDEARLRASEGKPVIAVWRNPDPAKAGHIALVGPGPMTPSGGLGVNTPVSASFFQGRPKANYVGKPLACAFTPAQAPAVRLYAQK